MNLKIKKIPYKRLYFRSTSPIRYEVSYFRDFRKPFIYLLFAPVPCSASINKSSAFHFGPVRVRILLQHYRVMAGVIFARFTAWFSLTGVHPFPFPSPLSCTWLLVGTIFSIVFVPSFLFYLLYAYVSLRPIWLFCSVLVPLRTPFIYHVSVLCLASTEFL